MFSGAAGLARSARAAIHLPEPTGADHWFANQRTRALAAELAPLTGRTKTSALTRALAQVRQRGYAVEDLEATVGDAGIGAPIVTRDGTVAGAIAVVGAADRLLARHPRGAHARRHRGCPPPFPATSAPVAVLTDLS